MTRTAIIALALAAALAPSVAAANSLAPVATAADPIPASEPPAAVVSADAADTPDINLHLNPVALLFGMVMAEADVRLAPNLSAGPMFFYARFFDMPSWGLGGYAMITRAEDDVMDDAWHLRPYAAYQRIDDVWFGDDIHFLSLGTTGGYQWFWDSGFNARLGAGLQLSIASDSEFREGGSLVAGAGSSQALGLIIDGNVGYAF